MGNRGIFAFGAIGAAISCAVAAPAAAQDSVALHSAVFVERASDGSRILQPATRLSRGDRVVTVLNWRAAAPGRQFTLTNPMPRDVYYQGSANGDEEVSVDGGRTWGKLGSLRTAGRLATPEDVTHLRWRVVAQQAEGRIAYSAIVR